MASTGMLLENRIKRSITQRGDDVFVRSEFARLAKDTPGIDVKFTIFLAKAYMYKEIGDYGVGLDAGVSLDAANDDIVWPNNLLNALQRH